MICKKCGEDNPNPWFEAVVFPCSPVPFSQDYVPINTQVPVRWACRECGRYHFRDGSLYDYETAKKEAKA